MMIPKKVSKLDFDNLSRVITINEIEGGISSMANEKSPRLDGLPINFIKILLIGLEKNS
jgi:hypothetical protein